MDTVSNIILKNLVYLSEHLCVLTKVLIHLQQKQIISQDESEIIESKCTTNERSAELFRTLMRKDLQLKLLLRILRRTGNEHLAVRLEEYQEVTRENNFLEVNNNLRTKWWPDEKTLGNSFFPRLLGARSLVEILHEKLTKDKGRTVVITQTAPNSKLTGLGGIGKTLTAKWYATEYKNEFNHIIWIDCGEGSLLRSFSKLGHNLKIKFAPDSKIEELAAYCYEVLSDLKCLWVFDNAEDYMGDDGIFSVMPKNEENFTCLVTSRSHDWGIEVNHGIISQFGLDVFDESECVKFLKANLKKELLGNEKILERLGRLLWNLPLALELSVAIINKENINLLAYIQKLKKYTELLETPNDGERPNLEKIMDGIMKISFEYLEHANEKPCIALLKLLAYIRPDDVESDFLMSVLDLRSKNENLLEETIQILEQNSFLTKRVYYDSNKRKFSVNIHRLIQEALRYTNENESQNTLRKILQCDGFLDYKLIPFRYSDETLKADFRKIGAQLIHQMELKKLLNERRFVEAAELSQMINEELNSATSLFNYAVCLGRCPERMKDAITWTKILYDQLREPIWGAGINFWDRILDGTKESADKYLAAAQLFFLYCKTSQLEKATAIFNEITELVSYFGTETAGSYMASLLAGNSSTQFYELIVDENSIAVKFSAERDVERCKKSIAFNKCKLSSDLVLPNNLEHLSYTFTEFSISPVNLQSFKMQQIIPLCLNSLKISHDFGVIVPVSILTSINCLQLHHVTLKLDGSRLTPEDVIFESLNFVREDGDDKVQENVLINEFLNIHKIKNLMLINFVKNPESPFYKKVKSNMIITMKDPLEADTVHLERMSIMKWEISEWEVKKLILTSRPFKQRNNMKIKELVLTDKSVDLTALPKSLEILALLNPEVKLDKVDSKSGQELRPLVTSTLANLWKLHLNDKSVSLLPIFASSCQRLRYLELNMNYKHDTLDLNPFPKKLETVRINGIPSYVSNFDNFETEKPHLNTLLFYCMEKYTDLRCYAIEPIVSALNPKVLVINYNVTGKYEFDSVVRLIKMTFDQASSIEMFAIGKFDFCFDNENEFNNSELAKYIDTSSNYYLFEKGKIEGDNIGRPMEESQFMELLDLQPSLTRQPISQNSG